MPLKKGFLSNQGAFSKTRLTSAILFWLISSYILYAFFYLFREAFIIIAAVQGAQEILILTKKEIFIYNLFYGAIASSLGFMFALKFILNDAIIKKPGRKRSLARRALNDQEFVRWSFLFWFGKVAGILGIMYLMFPMQYDINFLQDFPLFFILLPVVLFLSTWPALRLYIGKNSLAWLSISSIIFVVMSFTLAYKNFLSLEKINHSLQSNSVYYSYGLRVPKSKYYKRIERKSLTTDFYIVADSANKNTPEPLIYMKNTHTKIQLQELQKYLDRERAKLDEIDREQFTPNLHIDSRVPLSFVNELKHALRKAGIRQIQFSTGVKGSRYPSNYPIFKDWGIPQRLQPYHPELELFLDSAETIDYNHFTIRIPDSRMYRIKEVKSYNRLELKVDNESAYLNGKKYNPDEIQYILTWFVEKYSPEFIIIFSPSKDITFERYIAYLDLCYSTIYSLRNNMSINLYGEPISNWLQGKELYNIKLKYPMNIVEWTEEEKRLIQLLEKTKSSK